MNQLVLHLGKRFWIRGSCLWVFCKKTNWRRFFFYLPTFFRFLLLFSLHGRIGISNQCSLLIAGNYSWWFKENSFKICALTTSSIAPKTSYLLGTCLVNNMSISKKNFFCWINLIFFVHCCHFLLLSFTGICTVRNILNLLSCWLLID